METEPPPAFGSTTVKVNVNTSGWHTLHANATDPLNRPDQVGAHFNFYADYTAPTAIIKDPPPAVQYENVTALDITCNDDHACSDDLTVKIDDQPPLETKRRGYQTPALVEGKHHVSIFAHDQAGNRQSEPSVVTIVIDRTPPPPPTFITPTRVGRRAAVTVKGVRGRWILQRKQESKCGDATFSDVQSGMYTLSTEIDFEPDPGTYRLFATSLDKVNNSATGYSDEFIVAYALQDSLRIMRVNSTLLRVEWSPLNATEEYDLQWSPTRTFDANVGSITTADLSAMITVADPMEHHLLYFRIAARDTGAWSPLSQPWKVTQDCNERQYLDDWKQDDPLQWQCKECPEGASCVKDVRWAQVKAKFGWWRHKATGKTNFTKCIYAPACLGAPNPELQDRYLSNESIDAALLDQPEACNVEIGHRALCEGGERCRLCHACLPNHEHASSGKCLPCHGMAVNQLLLVGGVAFALLAAGLLVWLQIENKGEGGLSDALKKVLLNYLQVAALAAGFPLKWPSEVEAMFAVQSTVSTAGQYLLRPDCELSVLPPAIAFYNKMVMFSTLPPAIVCGCLFFWKMQSTCRACFCLKGEGRGMEASHRQQL